MIPLKSEKSTHSFPFLTILIIILNCIIYFYQIALGKESYSFINAFAIIPYEITSNTHLPHIPEFPHALTFFSSLFLHGNIVHLLGNMLFLWIFGYPIEDTIGHSRFILFYLLCGFVAGSVQIVFDPASKIPLIGASGSIAGILGAYMLLFPKAKISTLLLFGFFIKIIKIPAFFFLLFWISIQVLHSYLYQQGVNQGGIAYFAHIGGFITGLLLILFFLKRKSNP